MFNYMFKVKNRNTRTRWETGSKLTIKTPERRPCSSVSVIKFEQVITCNFQRLWSEANLKVVEWLVFVQYFSVDVSAAWYFFAHKTNQSEQR